MHADQAFQTGFVASPSREIAEQSFRCHRQGLGQLHNVFERDITLTSLYSADVIAMQPCTFREFLLRETSLHAKRPHGVPELGFDRCRGHLSSCRDDHYESTHDEWYLSCTAFSRIRLAENGCGFRDHNYAERSNDGLVGATI